MISTAVPAGVRFQPGLQFPRSPLSADHSSSVSSVAPTAPTPSVHFDGFSDALRKRHRSIPDADYRILQAMPKFALHTHQGGSADQAFLKYALIKTLTDPPAKGQKTSENPLLAPLRQGEKPLLTAEQIDAISEGQMTNLPLKALSWRKLQQYYRAQSDKERQKYTSDQLTDALKDQFRTTGLQKYRETSVKMNPFTKNLPASYLLAHLFAMEVASEKVRYAEYRVSPSGNNLGGNFGSTSIDNILYWVQNGFEDAQRRLLDQRVPFDYGIIVLLERQGKSKDDTKEAQVARSVKIAEDVVRLRKEGKYNVVGVDLAGDELRNPVSDFAPAFDVIRRYNDDPTTIPAKRLGITIHAGETPFSKNENADLQGWQSVEKAIDVAWSPQTQVRIGHGLQLVNSSEVLKRAFEAYKKDPAHWERAVSREAVLAGSPLLKKIIDRGIVVEMCPKSNVQTYGIHYYDEHPALFLLRLGVKVSLDADNRRISNSTITNEFAKLFSHLGGTYDDFKQMMLNGLDGAFVFDAGEKQELRCDAARSFQLLERDPDNTLGLYHLRHPRQIEASDPVRYEGREPNGLQYFGETLKVHFGRFLAEIWEFYSGDKSPFKPWWQGPDQTPCQRSG